ncbi:hypothetical protein [Ammoniphilus sp. 3BR4]|uniref:hypothetical protein n=1 Tax=Ammoniphilus sp. 3BR4 TaxID=3158265 RepID=UPI003467D741
MEAVAAICDGAYGVSVEEVRQKAEAISFDSASGLQKVEKLIEGDVICLES